MKKKLLTLLMTSMLVVSAVGCGDKNADTASTAANESASNDATVEDTTKENDSATEEVSEEVTEVPSVNEFGLEDGVYTATFTTDSSMFHINEAYGDKGTLTVEGGEMTIHITLPSQNIVNLFPGTAEDAQKDGAVLLEPTIDEVTYEDGTTEEVYGFDVPVPVIDEGSFYRIDGTHIIDKFKIKSINETDDRVDIVMTDRVVTLEVQQ